VGLHIRCNPASLFINYLGRYGHHKLKLVDSI
jgi:hypothetical protein